MAAGVDLKTILAQACALMQEILELSKKLVLEVRAEHYWTTYSLDSLEQLKSITHNLAKRLETTESQWGEPKALFGGEEGQKLWRSAVGLLRALPPVRAKYTEQLSRRRRQRIMGQEIEEVEELDPEVLQEEEKKFRQDQDELRKSIEAMTIMLEKLPDGLAPVEEPKAPEPEKQEPAEAADQPAAADQQPPADSDEGAPEAAAQPAEASDELSEATPDDFSPV
jgi:hypothetical protein